VSRYWRAWGPPCWSRSFAVVEFFAPILVALMLTAVAYELIDGL
jgi:hypothetical protein